MKKKLIAIICATLAMIFTLCACQDAGLSVPQGNLPEPTTQTVTNDDATGETTEAPTPEPAPEPTPEPTPDPEPVPAPTPVISDPFINETNYTAAAVGSISIMPKYVYWENGNLVAVCFICNGTDNTIYNINVESLSFTGNTGELASAAFGVCDGLSLAPMTYQEWTFTFGADCVSQYGADLSHLNTHSSTSYNF